jgi:8-oxo-dGTP pyrophosphatase MutT (NUDIX family)
MKVVGCFLEYDGRFVLLHRLSHKPDGDSWGLPAGKVDPGESAEAAIIRELHEETGYKAQLSQLKFLDEHRFFMPSGTTNDFAAYRDAPHDVVLETRSHSAFIWVSPKEAYAMEDIIFGLKEVFRRVGL